MLRGGTVLSVPGGLAPVLPVVGVVTEFPVVGLVGVVGAVDAGGVTGVTVTDDPGVDPMPPVLSLVAEGVASDVPANVLISCANFPDELSHIINSKISRKNTGANLSLFMRASAFGSFFVRVTPSRLSPENVSDHYVHYGHHVWRVRET